MPAHDDAPDAERCAALGARAGRVLRAGDLVVLSGELGAGKTTFTQGIGAGLGVRGEVTSPTFVIARVHPSLGDGPPLVHVDAYRLGGVAELDDLDLDTSLDDAVTVVEWGEGIAEGLADDRLEVRIERAVADGPAGRRDPRRVRDQAGRTPLAGVRDGAQPEQPIASASRTSRHAPVVHLSQSALRVPAGRRTSTTASPPSGIVGGPVGWTRATAYAQAATGCGKCGWCGSGLYDDAPGRRTPGRGPDELTAPPELAAAVRRASPSSRRPPGRNRHSSTDRHTTTSPSGSSATVEPGTSSSGGAPSRNSRSAFA